MTRNSIPALRHLVLDFDGSCTQISVIADDFLELYRSNFVKVVGPLSSADWDEAKTMVRCHSPQAGWTVSGCPSAPAAADPYILADEAARYILRRLGHGSQSPPPSLNSDAYLKLPAPWREDALGTFSELIEHGVKLHFISNSSSTFIQGRIRQLFGADHPALDSISVESDAGKCRICELPWDDCGPLSQETIDRFLALPAVHAELPLKELNRPVYLRRGAYFEAICRVFHGDLSSLAATVFCGDIWEMDLAMPYALGANVHLLDRTAPFDTYRYEREAIAACGGRARVSAKLSDLLAWL